MLEVSSCFYPRLTRVAHRTRFRARSRLLLTFYSPQDSRSTLLRLGTGEPTSGAEFVLPNEERFIFAYSMRSGEIVDKHVATEDDPHLDTSSLSVYDAKWEALTILDAIKALERSGIACYIVGIAALRYYGAWRVQQAWEICVPSKDLAKAEEILLSPHTGLKFERSPAVKPQPHSIHHSLSYFEVKGTPLRCCLIGSNDCHVECNSSDLERSQLGLPFPKLGVFAQSLLDSMDSVALSDLVDGMDLDDSWAVKHLELTGFQDVSWARRMNQVIRATAPWLIELPEQPRSRRDVWHRIVLSKPSRIGLEFPPGTMATRFRCLGDRDPRFTFRDWI